MADPQIVRLRYVEGDVRLSLGKKQEPDLRTHWLQATADLPLESGFTLATGTGRAEIEFEGGSLAYLAENSVLCMTDLSLRYLAPVTRLQLVTGTVSLFVEPVPGETFELQTPVGGMNFPNPSFVRVEAYLDGVRITPLHNAGSFNQPGVPMLQVAAGQSITYQDGRPIQIEGGNAGSAFQEWDKWVPSRVEERYLATEAALKASGLASPIPGLADLYSHGTFFACQPYGTCWEPTEAADTGGQIPAAATTTSAGRPRIIKRFYPPYCNGVGELVESVKDPVTGKEQVVRRTYLQGTDWALCYVRGWIHYRHSYVLVMGKKPPRRHGSPVRWIKVGKQVGYVPKHLEDIKGKPPLNLKYGIIVPAKKEGGVTERVSLKPADKIKPLSEAPKEFRADGYSRLTRVAAPTISAHLKSDDTLGSKAKGAEHVITYDYRKGVFVRDGTVLGGYVGRPVILGGLAGHGAGGFSSHGGPSGYSGGHSGSSAGGHSGGGSSYAGGSGAASSGHSGGASSGGSYSEGGSYSGGSAGGGGTHR